MKKVDPVVDTTITAIQVVLKDSMIFLSKVSTVAKTERRKEYGRRFILNLKVRIQICYS